jgi:capsular exopolysaccharide synthesis family protein
MDNIKIMSEINPRSHVAEAFRILRTNLHFSTVNHNLKSLLVTSPGPSEGKSTITANLGIVMAQTGAKVVLVDSDMRWAEQHRLFNLSNETGLTNVLIGSMEIPQVLRHTRLPSLKVITCGPPPPNPAELLASEKTGRVLAELSEMADIVLIDSPPTLMVADATILSSMVDGCVLVIKTAETKIEAVRQAKERLDKANARIVGTVLNAVEGFIGYDYYHSYYYGKKNRKEIATGKIYLNTGQEKR